MYRLQRFPWAAGVLALIVGAVGGCENSVSGPESTDREPGTFGAPISAIIGSGAGQVSVTPLAMPDGTFAARIKVIVRAKPNTTYLVQRAPELGRALGSDGVCQRALHLPPWSASDAPVVPAFVTFPLPASGPLTTLTTTSFGTAAVDFEFLSGISLAAGTRFDVMFRLADNDTAPTTELTSACFTVESK